MTAKLEIYMERDFPRPGHDVPYEYRLVIGREVVAVEQPGERLSDANALGRLIAKLPRD